MGKELQLLCNSAIILVCTLTEISLAGRIPIVGGVAMTYFKISSCLKKILHISIAALPTENVVSSNRKQIGNAAADLRARLRRVCVYNQTTLRGIDRVKMKMTYMFFSSLERPGCF
jgi:hypothetical protein